MRTRSQDRSWKAGLALAGMLTLFAGFVSEIVAGEMLRLGRPELGPPARESDANDAPFADAGAAQWGEVGDRVRLSGAGSFDDDDPGVFLIWQWEQLAGPSVALDGSASAGASFVPQAAGSYRFRLTVSDGVTESTDEVDVEINAATGEGKQGWS